jgi:hypothetical protein
LELIVEVFLYLVLFFYRLVSAATFRIADLEFELTVIHYFALRQVHVLRHFENTEVALEDAFGSTVIGVIAEVLFTLNDVFLLFYEELDGVLFEVLDRILGEAVVKRAQVRHLHDLNELTGRDLPLVNLLLSCKCIELLIDYPEN